MKIRIILLAFALLFLFPSFDAKANSWENGSDHMDATEFEKANSYFLSVFGSIKNNSIMTLCAEEDNINIPIFHSNPTAFRITATHPTYLPTDVIDQGANWTNCDLDNAFSRVKFDDETVTKIYDDGDVVIEAVNVNSWWRDGESMDVRVKGGTIQYNVTYFRIYKYIKGTNWDYPQVFVLYEDGNCRIAPQPPTYLSEVKFGSSVIIGASEDLPRPFSDIDFVEIDPLNMEMDIVYGDTTTAHITIHVDRSRNVVEVSNIKYDTSNHPFARFRSMWVTDGNADVDHIRVLQGEVPIMGGWMEINGTCWQFFRKTPSIHNTYSPDIKIEVINPIAIQTYCGQYLCAEGSGGGAVVANRNAIDAWEAFNLIDLGNGNVALQAANGQYLCAEGGGGAEVMANRDWIAGWETFKLIDQGNGYYSLQAFNGQYLCAEGGGGDGVVANRDEILGWETFRILDLRRPARVALQAYNGQYLCAEGGGGDGVVANRDAVLGWETFNLIDCGNGDIALQAYNGQYLCAEGGGGQQMVANRDAIAAWERFRLIYRGDGNIALQAYNGQYVCAEGGGGDGVVANRDWIAGWETFKLIAI